MNFARASRARSPPLSWPTRLWAASPRNQKRPRSPLAPACDGGGCRTLLTSSRGARGGRKRFRRLAPHLLDPQLAGEHLLVHLAGLELLDDRELALQFRLVPVALGLPGPRDRVALHPVVRVIADVLEGAEAVDLDHLVRDRVEEELVMAGQEDGRVDLLEERLDRLDRVDVHAVRRPVRQA